jgi:hypothetical protein
MFEESLLASNDEEEELGVAQAVLWLSLEADTETEVAVNNVVGPIQT